MREIKLNETITLDDDSSSLVSIVPLKFEEDHVLCKFLYSHPGNEREVSYKLFEKNGLQRPKSGL
jgi:hypothetical protein